MEMDIFRNEEKITQAQSSVVLLSKDVEDLQEDVEENSANITKVFQDVAAVQGDVAAVQGDVASNQGDITEIQGDVAAVQNDVVEVAADVARNSADITTLATFGTWCGYQDTWTTDGTITYDRIKFSASNNMNYASTPLNINTGINSNKCYYYLDIDICHISGIFTVPVSGTWRMTLNMYSRVDSGDYNYSYLYRNGQELYETFHDTFSGSGEVRSTGGRMVTLEASAGDQLAIVATKMDGSYWYIMYCAEYIPKM